MVSVKNIPIILFPDYPFGSLATAQYILSLDIHLSVPAYTIDYTSNILNQLVQIQTKLDINEFIFVGFEKGAIIANNCIREICPYINMYSWGCISISCHDDITSQGNCNLHNNLTMQPYNLWYIPIKSKTKAVISTRLWTQVKRLWKIFMNKS